MWNINALQRRIPCVIFQKFAVFVPRQDALAVKILLDLLKGYGVNGGFKLTGSGYPQIFIAPSGVGPPKVLDVQELARGSLSPCQVWWGSSFLFVCLFVTLLNVRVCARNFAMKALEYTNYSDAVG